ncbi:MAG: cupin domain-containing protein [bacterium]
MIQYIDTGACEREALGEGRGEAAEIVGPARCGAENVRGLLRWLGPGERYEAEAAPSHQLFYLLEGEGVFDLEGKEYPVGVGAGLCLSPGEGAALRQAGSGTLKVLHLAVPPA